MAGKSKSSTSTWQQASLLKNMRNPAEIPPITLSETVERIERLKSLINSGSFEPVMVELELDLIARELRYMAEGKPSEPKHKAVAKKRAPSMRYELELHDESPF